MEAQTATTAERGRHRLEDARGPAAAGRREARGPRRAALQGPGDGRVGRRLLPGARRRSSRSSRSASRRSASSAATRSRSSPTPAPSGPTRTSRSSAPARPSCPIYQTNSPEECQYVLDHSEAKAVILEDAEQLEKIRKVRDQLPEPRARDLDGADRRRRRDQLRRAARAGPRAAPTRTSSSRVAVGRAARTSPPTSTPPARPARRRAASSTTPTGATCSTWSRTEDVLVEDEVAYLFLPLAHAFARLIQLGVDRRRRDDRLLGDGPAEDHPQPDGGQADLLPVACRACSRRSTRLRGRRTAPDKEQLEQADRARHEGARDAAARRGGPAPSCRRRSTRPTRRCSRTSATCSAATSSRPSPAPRRSRRRSSSSSTPAACRCWRAGA